MEQDWDRLRHEKISETNYMAKSILTFNQKALLSAIANDSSFSKHFYLTGGTALSEFYLHHRFSKDLDFFSDKEIDKLWLISFVKKISKDLKIKNVNRREVFNRNLIFFNFKNGTVKTEFTYFPFTQIEKPKVIGNISIDSLLDIAVNKFFTIYQKPSARHFIDLYLILKEKKITWEQLRKLARIKFDTNIEAIQLGSQLVKAENIADLPKMLIELPEKTWRSYFLEKAKELKKEIAK